MENVSINNLIATRDRIQKSINDIDLKRKNIQNSITVYTPGVNREIQIKELEVEKIRINLLKAYKESDLQIKYNLGLLSESEYQINSQFLSDQLNDELKQIEANIAALNEQKKDTFSEIERIQKSNNKASQATFTNAKKDLARAYTVQIRSIAKFGGKEAVIGTISILINLGLTKLSKEVGNLELMVESVNSIISNIKTRSDIERAKRLRNNALRLLNSAEKRLKLIEKIVKTINRVLRILNIALRILRIAALLPAAPKALLVVLINLIDIVSALLIILTATQNTLNKLIYKVQELKRRLKEIGDIIDNKLSDPLLDLTELDVFNITTGNFGKLGILDTTYKGFRFVIKEENNTKFVVQGYKRRYATAINLDGNDVLIGEPSFTLDPDVLVEQLKLIIDERDLKP